eukprot:COSAG02_NODE_2497_length_8676_cov_18.607322_2_plen_148_part_00
MLKKLASVSCVVVAFVDFCFPVFSTLPSVLPDVELAFTLELQQDARTCTVLPKPSVMAFDDDESVGGSIGGLDRSGAAQVVVVRGFLRLGFVGCCADFEPSVQAVAAISGSSADGAGSSAGAAVAAANLVPAAAFAAAILRCFLPAK